MLLRTEKGNPVGNCRRLRILLAHSVRFSALFSLLAMNAGDDTLLFGASGFGEAMVDLKSIRWWRYKDGGGKDKGHNISSSSSVHSAVLPIQHQTVPS
jgi:hypothetical protein